MLDFLAVQGGRSQVPVIRAVFQMQNAEPGNEDCGGSLWEHIVSRRENPPSLSFSRIKLIPSDNVSQFLGWPPIFSPHALGVPVAQKPELLANHYDFLANSRQVSFDGNDF